MPAGDRRDAYAVDAKGQILLVTLDGDGNLARIVVTSAPNDPELVLDLDITQIGEPQAIAPRTAERRPALKSPHRTN